MSQFTKEERTGLYLQHLNFRKLLDNNYTKNCNINRQFYFFSPPRQFVRVVCVHWLYDHWLGFWQIHYLIGAGASYLCLAAGQPAYRVVLFPWSGFYGERRDSRATGSQPRRRREGSHWSVVREDESVHVSSTVTKPVCKAMCLCVPCARPTQNGSPLRGPTITMNRGCWSRANAALIIDCMPVRVPKWLTG